MEYWQKFSFITSFSKGLIGYSLRYLGEREAAECMSGVVGRVRGVQRGVQGEELRTRQTGNKVKDAEGVDSTYSAACELKLAPAAPWEVKKRLFNNFNKSRPL